MQDDVDRRTLREIAIVVALIVGTAAGIAFVATDLSIAMIAIAALVVYVIAFGLIVLLAG